MPSDKPSPSEVKLSNIQKELSRLHRRRLALNTLIRSIEEYLIVSHSSLPDAAPVPTRKPAASAALTPLAKELPA
jgi:hypothetical protein